MTVHYVVSIKLGGVSGKEKATTDKARHLKLQAKRVEVFSLRNDSSNRLLKVLQMLWLDVSYLLMLLLGRVNIPDVIIARTSFSLGTYLAGRIYQIPVIREVHADPIEEIRILFSERPLLRWLGTLQGKWEVFFTRHSSGLIFNNPLLQRHYVGKYGISSSSIAVYNGADTDAFYPTPVRQTRNSLGLSPERNYLLFLGSVSPWHGIEFAIQTFLELRERTDDVDLLIVGGGSGSYATRIQEKYSDEEGIHFVGPVDNEKAMCYVNAATACLLPVNNIRSSPGSPIKLFDYIACGKPIITQQDTIGYSDLVNRYGLGMDCNFSDSASAAGAIQEFLEDMDPEHYRAHNRWVAENELNWARTIEKWLAFAYDLVQ